MVYCTDIVSTVKARTTYRITIDEPWASFIHSRIIFTLNSGQYTPESFLLDYVLTAEWIDIHPEPIRQDHAAVPETVPFRSGGMPNALVSISDELNVIHRKPS